MHRPSSSGAGLIPLHLGLVMGLKVIRGKEMSPKEN